jgi:hypothetical protein
MAWYNTGTIALTNGSATVTGSGTNFLVGAQIGEALYAPDGKLYEIQTINSATVITLASNYLGSTASAQGYQIIPTQSLVADLASDVTDLISDFADVRDYAGNGKFNDGAVGTPGITFTQDQDNGLYRIGSNNWALAAGGQKIVDISTSGIDVTGTVTADGLTVDGTTATIQDDSANLRFENSAGARTGYIQNRADAFEIWDDQATPMIFGTNNAERLRIDSVGTLFQGTTSPTLHSSVTGIVFTNGSLLTESARGADKSLTLAQNIAVDAGNTWAYLSTDEASYYQQYGGNHYFATAASGTAGADATLATKMTILNNGSVGIGTSSPSTPLNVYNASNPYAKFEDAANYLNVGVITSNYGLINSSLPISFQVSDVERLRIAADGSISTPTAGTSNVRFGVNAGNSIASGGNYNTVVGDEAGTAITTGDLNTALGYIALAAEDTGGRSTAIGAYALSVQNVDGIVYNTAVGYNAGGAIATGLQNTFLGALAGDALDVGVENVALGYASLTTDTKGNYSTAIGTFALAAQNFTSVTSAFNTGVGYGAGSSLQTGVQNTLIGAQAGDALNGASSYNTAAGYSALSSDTLGARSTAFGHEALATQNFTSSTVTANTALGFQAGRLVSTGTSNTLVGHEAGTVLTTGTANTFLGSLAGDATDDGNNNTAVGKSALSANCADANTAIGNSAAIGCTGSDNTVVGYYAAGQLSSGSRNLILGHESGSNLFGNGLFQVTTHNDRIVLGTTEATNAYIQIDWTVVSDERDKTEIQDVSQGLDFVKQLRPISYKFRTSRDDATPKGNTKYGFSAQDVLALEGSSPVIVDNEESDKLKLTSAHIIPVLTKAIQEQQTLIESLTARIAALEE